MKPTFAFALTLVASLSSVHAAQFQFATQTFTVPDGFEVEQIAGPPAVDRPISASFDEQGRLYVTDSSGSNDKVDKQLAEKPHRVLRLDPADASGKFTRHTIFADHMMFPEGCLWYDGSLYVSAPPSIWKLTDTNADGIADQRVEWHEGKTLTGCANDLHGPYLGPDGWIYWCKGAFAKQTYDRPGYKPINTRASHIFRAPPDHSYLEPVLTAGMDNPVGVVFSPGGERFMCGTFLMHPEAGKRDGVVHAIYGGVYGKSNDVLDDHKKTGDLMPIMVHLGAAAPCSVIRYESDAFGTEYRDNLFVCCFNMHKITRHVLEPERATFKTKDSDFLVSSSTDFHPTDVIEDADGSLIVVDTGGWYKLCCPTSQLSKPDVLGAIYRIRRRGAPKLDDPRGLSIAWGKLSPDDGVKLLDDARPAVRKRAIHELSKLGSAVVPALTNTVATSDSLSKRRNAVWTLTRINDPAARAGVKTALLDSDPSVALAAIHSTSLWRDQSSLEPLLKLLTSGNPSLQRATAEALGRIGNVWTVPALLALAAQPHDRILEHSLIYSLIEIDDPIATGKRLARANPYAKRATLIALDQMDGGNLKPETVAPLLGSPDAQLRSTAAWIAGHHPEWGATLAEFFQQRLAASDLTAADTEELKNQLAEFATSQPIQELVAARLRDANTSPATRKLLLQSIASTSLKNPPEAWVQTVSLSLVAQDESVLEPAVAAARVLSQSKTNLSSFSVALLGMGQTEAHPPALRLRALAALPTGLSSVTPELLHFLCANVDPEKPVSLRADAVTVLAKAKLTDEQLISLCDALKAAGPLEMTRLLGAFETSTNEKVGMKLLGALKESKGLSSLRPDLLQTLLAKYPDSVQQQGKELLALLQVDSEKQRAHLEELLGSLQKGDIRRGQAIFNSEKAACSSCHAMGYLGGHVGPDLTSIGQVRTERDLLESIVYPSASFVRSYEPYIVRTKSDEDYNGVLRKDAPDEVVLATGPTTEARIARSDIADMRPSTVSVMPAGMEQQLSKQELADLVAFLKATKWGAQ
ncbi:MAG TPA: PVC-type heme-binding CxxCH protein [Candidatus Limnocylindrales bacterium]|nr:PVC-type heme-binding CxxCH protein [Candidatus Limnocylindrales bacterium]